MVDDAGETLGAALGFLTGNSGYDAYAQAPLRDQLDYSSRRILRVCRQPVRVDLL